VYAKDFRERQLVCPPSPRRQSQHGHKHAFLDSLSLLPWLICKQPRVKKRAAAPRRCAAAPCDASSERGRDASSERDTRKVLRSSFLVQRPG
jgi:hypothetical protein